jgi:paraquat-inducible protein A
LRGALLPLLLLASFALNVAALVIPFLDVRRGLSTDEYSLPRSILLLWEKGLYVLAAVIVVFSVCFPFAKLAVLCAILLDRLSTKRRRRWLDFVERYGKWSMVDVFIVCLMIALADDQLLLDASPRIGILCFTIAIVISMVCSAWMHAALEPHVSLPALPRASITRLLLWQLVILGLLVAVLLTPFLWIDDWLLVDRPISIVGAIVGLWNTGAHTLAAILGFFLALAPCFAVLLSVIVLSRRRKRRPVERLHAFASFVRHWDMLDVFALALGIFLVEGRAFVRTELASGAFLLALLLAVYWPASALYRRRAAR